MYNIKFYQDKKGNKPVKDYMDKLNEKTDKDSRINFTKIIEYVNALQLHGKALGMPYIKHLTGEIWELRPLKNRILFFGYDGNNFVLLSHFIKKTKKTPKREIEKAKKLMDDYKERGKNNENEQRI